MPEIGPVLEKPVHALLETAQLLDDLFVQNLDGKKRNDTDHGTGAYSVSFAANIDAVVVEAMGFVPQPGPTKIVHRISDGDKVFQELGSNVFVRRIVDGQFERHGKH